MSRVSLIVAMAENRVIGVNNTLPWRLPADLKHFRRLTTGHAVIMGRRNYESIGKPLPDRTNIVVTQNLRYQAPGCIVVHSIDEALRRAANDPEIFVIGGAKIYEQTLDRADRLYLTLVHATIPGDTYFPEINGAEWAERENERHEAEEKNSYAFSFITLDKQR
jgi:dihydrofolate reductase